MMPFELHPEIGSYLDRHMKKGTVNHFYLITGEPGIGRRTVASGMAKKLLCTSGESIKPCNKCLSCRTFDSGANADYIFVELVDKNIVREDVSRVVSEISLRPMVSERKVMIIADAEHLTDTAANVLLKTLEEPPPYAVLIMTVTGRDQLPETIVSRAFHFPLKRQPVERIRQLLGKVPEAALRYGNGNIGKTKAFMDPEFETSRELGFRLAEKLTGYGNGDISEKDFLVNLDMCLEMLMTVLRDMLAVKAGSEMIINTDMRERLGKIAAKTDIFVIEGLFRKTAEAKHLLEMFTNKRLVFNNLMYGI